MVDLNLDWNTVLDEQQKEASAQALAESDYDIVVAKAEATRASTGSPMIKMSCDVTSGPYEKRRLFTNLVFKTDSATAMRMTLRKLAGLGISREWLAEANPSITVIAQTLVGKTAVARVKQREYQGEMRNDIDMFTQSDGSSVPAPPAIGSASPGAPASPAAPLPSPEAELPVPDRPEPVVAEPAPAPAPAPAPEPTPATAAEPTPATNDDDVEPF